MAFCYLSVALRVAMPRTRWSEDLQGLGVPDWSKPHVFPNRHALSPNLLLTRSRVSKTIDASLPSHSHPYAFTPSLKSERSSQTRKPQSRRGMSDDVRQQSGELDAANGHDTEKSLRLNSSFGFKICGSGALRVEVLLLKGGGFCV